MRTIVKRFFVFLAVFIFMSAINGYASDSAYQTASAIMSGRESLFDWNAILNDPLDVKIYSSEERDGYMLERFEYTSRMDDSKPERVRGIIAYPKGASNLPALFWSMPGMAAGDHYWPEVFAKKGYVCMCITLPHQFRDSFNKFNAKDPRSANLTKLAVDQMRAITYLTQRPEVDKERIGMGGASYGGFFSTLITGEDTRIKAGFSFFSGGNCELGTALPQFTKLESQAELEVWNNTIDPAWRLTKRGVPFLWCFSANDNWFYLPSCVKTYKDAIGEKRMAIIPQWQHGFPENVDKMLIDWMDVYLLKTRKPYNEASAMEIRNENGRMVAKWGWTGDNTVKKAELIVSYGPALPWHGWVQRHHEILSATIDGNTASAIIPATEKNIVIYTYGNITDENGVVISTLPLTVTPAEFGIAELNPDYSINCFQIGDFEKEDVIYMDRSGFAHSPVDTTESRSGKQCLRVPPQKSFSIALFNVPCQSHVLKLWLKTKEKTTATVKVSGFVLPSWKSPLVDKLRRSVEATPMEVSGKMPVYAMDINVDNEWREFSLACPYDGTPVETYILEVAPAKDSAEPVWLDTLRFEPVWK